MCDTFAAVNLRPGNPSVLFGKNSDRRVNEPCLMIHAPRKEYSKNAEAVATYIVVPQARQTHEVLLFKPSWIWGAEMGCNEFGLCIGNEAVFSKEPIAPKTLIGMDYVRLALERCETALAALNFITEYLAIYGQGGNCVFKGDASYHNAFILADPGEAYVLETAGSYWAAKRIRGTYAISNCLSIGGEFDFSHPQLIEHAVEMGWCEDANHFDFARCYGDWGFMSTTGGLERRRLQESLLYGRAGVLTAEDAKRVLRLHDPSCEQNPFEQSGKFSVCMHGGDRNKNQTTGSFVAALGTVNRYWATNSSLPCVSAFKPICFGADAAFQENETDRALAFWKSREMLRRAAAMGAVDFNELRDEAFRLEASFETLKGSGAEVSQAAFALENELVERRLENLKINAPGAGAAISEFTAFWNMANAELFS